MTTYASNNADSLGDLRISVADNINKMILKYTHLSATILIVGIIITGAMKILE